MSFFDTHQFKNLFGIFGIPLYEEFKNYFVDCTEADWVSVGVGTNFHYKARHLIEKICKKQSNIIIQLWIERRYNFVTKESEYYLYFLNDNHILRNDSKDIKIQLDLNRLDYLLALSSKRCGCKNKNVKGFEFHVSMKVSRSIHNSQKCARI